MESIYKLIRKFCHITIQLVVLYGNQHWVLKEQQKRKKESNINENVKMDM